MIQKKIALDMDEVVVDLLGQWENWYRNTVNDFTTSLEVTDWDVSKTFNKLPKDEIYSALSIPGFFYSCPAIEGAIQGVKRLVEDLGQDVYFLTYSGFRTSTYEKIEWIRAAFGDGLADKVIAVSDSDCKVAVVSSFDIIVDDRSKTLSQSMKIKNKPFCILFDRMHNKDAVCGIDYDVRVMGWEHLIDIFEKDLFYGKEESTESN